MIRFILFAIFAVFSAVSWAEQDTDILVRLEEPGGGSGDIPVCSGVSNLRGWALAPNGIDRVALVFPHPIFDIYFGSIPYGGLRTDVEDVFPDYPDAANSGFSMAFAYSSLNSGLNQFSVVAYDKLGNYNAYLGLCNVAKFDSSFISDPTAVDVSTITNISFPDQNTLALTGLTVNDALWDVVLKWRTATQGFEFESISEHVEIEPDFYHSEVEGKWVGTYFEGAEFTKEHKLWLIEINFEVTDIVSIVVGRREEGTYKLRATPLYDSGSDPFMMPENIVITEGTYTTGKYGSSLYSLRLSDDTVFNISGLGAGNVRVLDDGSYRLVRPAYSRGITPSP